MWAQIATVLLPSLLILGQTDPARQTAPRGGGYVRMPYPPTAAEEIDRAIEALGDESFPVREQASEFLWRAGSSAGPALREALHSGDAEVAARAARILRQFEYGIYPDTPREVVALIGRYRYGTETAKLAVLKTLLGKGETTTLLTLLKTEPDETSRKQLTDGLLKDLDKLAGAMFIQGDWAKAEELLQLAATDDGGMRNYAAYLLLCGRLEAKIAELREPTTGAPNAVDAKLLAYLLRAKGDLPGARAAAEKAADPLLTAGILFELGDWQQLARLHQDSPEETSATPSGGIVDLGYAAAYHRLAGNARQFEEAVTEIKELAARKPNKLWYCAETLIINERYEDALELLEDGRRTSAFELLCLQTRFGEALRLAGIADPRGPYWPWFAPPQAEAAVTSARRTERFSLGLHVAAMLFRLGEKDEAVRLFLELGRAAENDNDLSLRSVCEAEYEVGLTKQAFEHAAAVLRSERNTSLLRTLFPGSRDAADIWWEFFCREYPQEPRDVILGRLRRFLQSTPAIDTADENSGRPIAEAEKVLRGVKDADRGRWLASIGETYLARGEPQSARDYFLLAAHTAPSVSVLMRLGDLAAADAQWEAAARWYGSAWNLDRTKPTALLLQGRALLQAGQQSEGRKLIEAARFLPLGSAETRCGFADDLQQRGLSDEAVHQWELTLRTGEPRSAAVNQAAERLAEVAAGKDDLRAAAYWQWPLLRCIRTSTNNLGIEGYLRRAHLIHKSRARGLLAAGKTDEAVAEIWLSHAALPGDVGLALELVPELEKADRRQEADRLFAQVFAVNHRVCDDFPRSAGHQHDLARLAVGCRRRLDEALGHANQALALEPQNPAYLGTLAELHFQRGDRQQAIELAKRCVQLAPKQERFHQQLERFQGR
jgi:tetratricopeptide (TPR) repeat protein